MTGATLTPTGMPAPDRASTAASLRWGRDIGIGSPMGDLEAVPGITRGTPSPDVVLGFHVRPSSRDAVVSQGGFLYLFAMFAIRLILSCLLLAAPCLAENTVCGEDLSAVNGYQFGLSHQVLVPDELPRFDASVPAYGLMGSIPVGKHAIHLQAQYGSAENISLFLGEAGFRLMLPTPFFTGFALGGVHLLKYGAHNQDFRHFGVLLGTGVQIALSRSLRAILGIKTYVQDKSILSIGGGLNFLL